MADGPSMIAAVRRKREEYWSTGAMETLAESVRLGRAALVQFSGEGALQGLAANELAASLGVLYEATGELRHLDEHLALLDHALELLPPEDPNLAPVNTNLAAGRLQRFLKLGAQDDLVAAVAAARRGIEVSQPDDPNLAVRYSNLAGALRALYDLKGDPEALDESITAGRKASAGLQPTTHNQPLILASLAGSLQLRGLRMSSYTDIEESIAIARHAVAVAPPASPWRRAAGNILAASLRASSELTGDLGNLSEAIALHRENADLVPSRQPEYATHMLHLAATLLVRYERQQDWADLDAADDATGQALESGNALSAAEAWSLRATCLHYRVDKLAADGDRPGAEHAATQAVEAAAQSLTLTAPTARERPDRLMRSCNVLAARYQLTGTREHRTETVAAYREVIESLGTDTAAGQLAMLNLGIVYLRHAQSVPASQTDVAEAIRLFRHVLAAAEPGERLWVNATFGMIRALAQLFEVAREAVDAEELARLYRQVTEAHAVPPKRRAVAGLLAGTVLMQTGHTVAASWILTDAVRQLPAVAWRGARRQSRESQLADLSELGCDAAASHLAAGRGDPEAAARATEVVEQGRAVLWADTLQLRSGDAELRQSQSELAARLHKLAADLDIPEEISVSPLSDSRTVDHRMALAVEWDETVARVREQAPDFLQPAKLEDLLPASAHSPVVIVNVSRHRCDALIVTSARVRPVPLPSLSAADIDRYTHRYMDAYARLIRPGTTQAGRMTELKAPDQVLSDVLEWLWDAVAEPVLDALGIVGTPAPGQPWPRIWWCPTGPLSLLPLHAAGYHAAEPADDSMPRTILDRAISSYTPTLGALADASRVDTVDVTDTDDGTILFVGLPETPGAPPLPCASHDRDLITGMLGARCHILYGDNATTNTVRAELPSRRWAHFSCHGEQNLIAPSKGGLRLWDGTLTVADLSVRVNKGEFAFLAACQTATGGTTLPNEAISLAAALHYAGYRHVIATLWSVYDLAAAEITRMVYDDLAKSGQLTPERSAQALHSAVRHLRDINRAKPSWWTPFIHIGP
jgi:tetratricopeptide (TPR) repeat protein